MRRTTSSAGACLRAVAALAVVACRSPTEQRLGAAAPSVRSAPDDELRAHCVAHGLACRENVRVVLRRDDETTFDRTFAIFPPALTEGVLSLLPGETVQVEAERQGESLVLSKVVASPEHPERTLTFRFAQLPRKTGMILIVESPFDEPLKFDLGMMPLDGDPAGIVKTSSCPVVPRIQSLESWPHPIFQLFAARFRFVASGTAPRCE